MKAVCCTNVLRKKEFAVKKVYCEKTIWTLQVLELIFVKGGRVFLQVLVNLWKRIDLFFKKVTSSTSPKATFLSSLFDPKASRNTSKK